MYTEQHDANGGTDRLIRRAEVLELVGLSRDAVYKREKAGKFPRGIKTDSAHVRYKLSDIQEYQRTIAAGQQYIAR